MIISALLTGLWVLHQDDLHHRYIRAIYTKTRTWDISELNMEFRRGTLQFFFSGLEDDHDLIMERALAYRVPEMDEG